jgi:hypothetical protein
MFESNMDEYLDEELESANQALDMICGEWDKKVCAELLAFKASADLQPSTSSSPYPPFHHPITNLQRRRRVSCPQKTLPKSSAMFLRRSQMFCSSP